MEEIKKDVISGNKTIRVILQFPDESEESQMVQASVKSILMMELDRKSVV